MYGALNNAVHPAAPEPVKAEPAVSIRASVKPEYVVCLEDGTQHKLLKRHLQAPHGLTPAAYRAKWSLRRDYPLVAPNYSQKRREVSLALGLGRKKAAPETVAEPAPAAPSKRRGRPPKASVEQAPAEPATAAKPARKPRAKKAPTDVAK